MGCPSLYVWALIAAAYTTVQSFGFLALNVLMVLIHADVYKAPTGFFEKVSIYTLPGDSSSNCTVPVGKVSPESVVAYQYTFLVFHVLWIISGLVLLAQLCRKTRYLWDYVLWMAVAVILLLLDTITGIFFIVDRAGMDPEDVCQEAAFCMILLSFRWFILFVLNIVCVVVVALAMRRHKAEHRKPQNNYLDPPSTRKGLQSDKQEIGPPPAIPRKPPAAQPTEIIGENDYLEQVEMESEVPNQVGPGDQEAPTYNVPQTSFRTHTPIQVHQQGDYHPPTTHNWEEVPLDQHRYPVSDPQPQTGDEHNYPPPQQFLDNTKDYPITQEEPYPFSYTAAFSRSMEQDGQPFQRFGVHSERQGDFARRKFDDEQRHMPPPHSRHAYDNQAMTSDAPYEEDSFPHEAPGPQGGHRPPPRTKRNASNRRKRAAPQPKEAPTTEDSIEEVDEEEEEEQKAKKTPKPASLAPTASFDPRPFSYLNPTFRPTDHADVKAMKSHTADIVKTLDQETKQLKEKDMLSEGSDSDATGIISSTLVRNFLHDSERRNNVKRSTSLREQLAKSGKAASRQQSFNKQSPNRPNAQRDLGPIEESNSGDPVSAARPHRRHTGDSARPARPAVDKDEKRRPYGDDTRHPRGEDRDRGAQRRPHNDRRDTRRDQTDNVNEDDYDSSDYEDEETNSAAQSVSANRHREPVFITAV